MRTVPRPLAHLCVPRMAYGSLLDVVCVGLTACAGDATCEAGGGYAATDREVFVEAGSPWLGTPTERWSNSDLVLPVIRVTVSRGFWIQTAEVTNGAWEQFLPARAVTGTDCTDPTCPIMRVSLFDAMDYANRLSAHEGRERCYDLSGCTGTAEAGTLACDANELDVSLDCLGWRLPTLAEWELAVRGGRRTDDVCAAFGTAAPCMNEVAWHGDHPDTGPRLAHPVATVCPTSTGLHDPIGNVQEWVWHWFHDGAVRSEPLSGICLSEGATDPTGCATRRLGVVLAGGWFGDDPTWLAKFGRYAGDRPQPYPLLSRTIGFRLVRTDPSGSDLPRSATGEAAD